MAAISMYNWQLGALGRMHNGCVLTGEPGKSVGAGKTRTAIAYWWTRVLGGTLDHETGVLGCIQRCVDLVVITTARKRNTKDWETELARFGISTDSTLNPLGVTISVDSWNNVKKYVDAEGKFFIFDEQKALGGGAWGRSLVKIAKRNQWIMLSGTPGDDWMDYCQIFVANGFYRNRTEFKREHVLYDTWASYPRIRGYRGLARLRSNRARVLVTMNADKRAKRHVEWVPYPYSSELVRRVETARSDPETGEPYRNASALCQALRFHSGASEGHSRVFLEIARRYDRVIVFYNYNWELDILRELAAAEGIQHAELNGDIHDDVPPSHERWWYFVQYAAGAEAWNCVSTNCTIFWSASYSWKQVEQAMGRIDRINTPFDDLFYYILTNESSIEKRVRRALERKEDFNANGFWEGLSGV